ncbi:MAG: MGH1-like glycoside hydrolase domain-containing protein [Actinomycetota bacterium]
MSGWGWNTWEATAPSEVRDPRTGLAVRVSAYSTKANDATSLPFSRETTMGPRLPDGRYLEASFHHHGSRVRVRAAADGDDVCGAIEVAPDGEWGLRFWFTLEVGFPGAEGEVRLEVPAGEAAYVDPAVAIATWRGGVAAFAPAIRPVTQHLYDDREDVLREFVERGYYYRPPARERGRWAVFRFNAITPQVVWALGVGADEAEARSRLAEVLAATPSLLEGRLARADAAPERSAAIRDVLNGNTVWNPAWEAAYTPTTRGWVSHRFGGFIVWQVDAWFHVILAAHVGDDRLARANLEAALGCRTETGMLAALRSGLTDWVDRSHPPFGAHAVWIAAQGLADATLLERAYPVLRDAYRWWWSARDGNGDRILEYGSSPVGDGHFVHTRLAAMDESFNDNSPVHDELGFVTAAHTLDGADVGLNSLLVHEAEMLGTMAERLGRAEEALELRRGAQAHAARICETLWDEQRGVFANRRWDGAFVRSLSPMSFAPLFAGVATPEQAERLVREWLRDPARFGGPFPVAGTPHEDPASLDNEYWRGRVWPPLNYVVYRGLRRYGFDEDAAWVAAAGDAMFLRSWRDGRRSYENFNQRTGEGGDSPDAEPFYTWGTLLPMLAEVDLLDLDPIDGLCVGSPASPVTSATLPAGAWGTLRAEIEPDGVSLIGPDGLVLRARGTAGRFRAVAPGAGGLSLTLPATLASIEIEVPWAVGTVTLDAGELATGPGDRRVLVPPGPNGRALSIARA